MNRARAGNGMVTVNGIEKKHSPAAIKKNVKAYRVIGCSRLTGGNDDDECDSVAYYACSFRGRTSTSRISSRHEISREVQQSFQCQLMYRSKNQSQQLVRHVNC